MDKSRVTGVGSVSWQRVGWQWEQSRAESDPRDGSRRYGHRPGPQGDLVEGRLTEAQVPWLPQ